MNLKNEFNRLAGMFGQGVERAHDAADDLRGGARAVGRRAQDGLRHGTDHLMSVEGAVMRVVRDRPQFLLIAVVCLLALIVTKVVMDQSDQRR